MFTYLFAVLLSFTRNIVHVSLCKIFKVWIILSAEIQTCLEFLIFCCCSVRKKVSVWFRALSLRVPVGVSATMYRYSNLIKLTLELDRNLTFAMALAKITNSYYLCTLIYSTLRCSIILKCNITIQLRPVFYSSESEISWKKMKLQNLLAVEFCDWTTCTKQ